jgi:hypothetical protein
MAAAYIVFGRSGRPCTGRSASRFVVPNGPASGRKRPTIGARRPRSGESGSTSTRKTGASKEGASVAAGSVLASIGTVSGK